MRDAAIGPGAGEFFRGANHSPGAGLEWRKGRARAADA